MASMQPRTKTSFLVISDTHDLDLETPTDKFVFRKPTPKVDVVLHCGDLTANGSIESHQQAIRMLGDMDAELKLVIAGNHDIDLDKNFFTQRGGNASQHEEALKLWKSIETRALGIVFLDEGTHSFTLRSGARFTIYASPYTPQYGESAFQYPSNHDRYNLTGTPSWAKCVATTASAVPDFPIFDIPMTHGPPKYILDDTVEPNNGGCEHLRKAVCRSRPRLHCFGHIHRGWGARRAVYKELENTLYNKSTTMDNSDDALELMPPEFVGRNQCKRKGFATLNLDGLEHGNQTLFLNAAIMDDDNEPSNPPWLVHLDLPTSHRSTTRT